MVRQISKTNVSVVDSVGGLIDYLSGKTADKMVLNEKKSGGYELGRNGNVASIKWPTHPVAKLVIRF